MQFKNDRNLWELIGLTIMSVMVDCYLLNTTKWGIYWTIKRKLDITATFIFSFRLNWNLLGKKIMAVLEWIELIHSLVRPLTNNTMIHESLALCTNYFYSNWFFGLCFYKGSYIKDGNQQCGVWWELLQAAQRIVQYNRIFII